MHLRPISPRRLAVNCALGALPCALFAASEASPQPGTRPNIIVCMVDDMGYSDSAPFGGEIDTPNLSRLAREGVRFNNFQNCSRCCPSRASILTGLYPHQAGVGFMTAKTDLPAYQGGLFRPCTTLAEVTRSVGYTTAISGKWHLQPHPRQVGFEVVETWFAAGATSYFQPFDGEGRPSTVSDSTFYATDYFADGVVRFIEKSADQGPFFVYWTPTAPHYPIHAKAKEVAKYRPRYAGMKPADLARQRFRRIIEMGLFDPQHPWDVPEGVLAANPNWFTEYRLDTDPPGQAEGYRPIGGKSKVYDPYANCRDMAESMAIYAAMIDCFDQGLGRVLTALEAAGVRDNTLIIFCSDNGCSDEIYNIGPPLAQACNTPFRKAKKSAYFGGTASPFIIYWPQATADQQRGAINRSFAHLPDIMATVLEASRATWPERDGNGRPVPQPEGRSLLPALRGATIPLRNPIFLEHEGNCAVITEHWKATSDKQEPWQLYDLTQDRFERINLAAKHPERVEQLATAWQHWANRVGALRSGQPKLPKVKAD